MEQLPFSGKPEALHYRHPSPHARITVGMLAGSAFGLPLNGNELRQCEPRKQKPAPERRRGQF